MYYNYQSEYETRLTMDIDDPEIVRQLRDDDEIHEQFRGKLEEVLQYTDVKYQVRLDTINQKVEITISFEGIQMSVEEAVFDVFHDDEEDEDW